ncbi:MAG: PorP/SprF family type IX secretion system membrane protein [Chitinophagales bacterium]|nr:PorP/SprF family type IX secretion system membrane protein [Chitinophagales bacterium]
MTRRLLSALAFSAAVLTSFSQDIHFSQFYAAPLTLNPASTGDFDGLFRITGIYRNQWLGVANVRPFFSTPSVGVDFALLDDKFEGTKIEGSKLGVGLHFTNDQQNEKTFSTNQIMASIAWQQALAKNRVTIGIGLQGGVYLKNLNSGNFQFGSGFLPDLSYDKSLEGEGISSTNLTKFNLNAGLNISLRLIKNMSYSMGFSAMNLTRPSEQYLNSSKNAKLPMRFQVHGGFQFDIKRVVLLPGYLFQTQAKAHEGTFGLTAGIHFINKPEDKATLFLGLWSRLNTGVSSTLTSAIIPKAGIEFKRVRLGFAYDIGLGPLKKDVAAATSGRAPNAFELSLSYIFKQSTPKEYNWLFNPRF